MLNDPAVVWVQDSAGSPLLALTVYKSGVAPGADPRASRAGSSAIKEGAEAWGKRLGGPSSRALGPAAAAKLRKRPIRKATSFEGDWDLEGVPWSPP